MKCLAILVIISLVASSNAWFFGGPAWDGLKVTFGLNPFDSYTFASLPRTVAAATADGWKLKPASGSAHFCGQRYIKYDSTVSGNDSAVMLLFDAQGFIAGIQAGIPNNLANGFPPTAMQPPMIAEPGNGWFTITAYFVRPDVVCGSGRSQSDFDDQGTGTGLFILNSATNPREVMTIPMTEDAQVGTQWTRAKCFISMGRHYWYNLRTDMNCDEFKPVFLMYNSGKLNAFGWAFQGDFASKRYEHPTSDVFSNFLDPVPQCLHNINGFSTMHIYLDNSPRTNFC